MNINPIKPITAFILFFSFFFSSISLSQSKTAELNGDCKTAIEISPTGSYAFKKSPEGYGEEFEIHHNSSTSKHYFKEENNTAWFTFVAKKSTTLTFEILPLDIHSDFDFLLFQYTGDDFCNDLKQKKIKPVRTNISRFDTNKLGVTGLGFGATDEFVPAGIGNNLSKAITTIEGERYYLVINNVYGSNSPFKLRFKHYTTITISGTLKDEKTGETVPNADITWEESTGELLAETTADKNGKFEFEVPILRTSKAKAYVLTATDEDFNFTEKIVFASQKDSVKQVKLILPKMVAGEKMSLHNIHFYGNEAITLPTSQKSMKRLYRFMKHNKQYSIRIEGHTNGCDGGRMSSQKLSTERAKTVKRYLVEKGIDAKRTKTIGYGCSHMLYPIHSSEEKQSLNRRVEFVIIDFNSANTD